LPNIRQPAKKAADRKQSGPGNHFQLDIALTGVFFIRPDNHLHEFVAYDVFVREVDEFNPFHV
jgi:hypothetical protein